MKNITRQQLEQVLTTNAKNAVFASFDSLTEPKMVKTMKTLGGSASDPNPHFGRVQKFSEGNFVLLFTNPEAYKKMVNRRLEAEGKEGNFEPVSNWFNHISGTPLVEKKSDTSCKYLYVLWAQKAETLADKAKEMGLTLNKTDKEILSTYKTGKSTAIHKSKTSYLLDGMPFAKKDIIGLSESSEGKQGGLEDKVIVRVYSLDSITEIRVGGETYRIVG